MSNTDSEKDFISAAYKVKERITKEQALQNLRRDVEQANPRGDVVFKSFFTSSKSVVKTKLLYAPVYHAFTEGRYSWETTRVENFGNALIGNNYQTVRNTKTLDDKSHFVIHKNELADGGKVMLYLTTYQKDLSNALINIEIDEVFRLPLLTPLLKRNTVFNELSTLVSRAHKGEYKASELAFMLVLVPILEVEYIFMSKKYLFYVNLYDGETDTLDVPTDSKIENTARRIKKANKIFKIIKLCMLCLVSLDFIIEIIKSVSLTKDTSPPWTLGFLLVLMAIVIFVPRKALNNATLNITTKYHYMDDYITDRGNLSFKSILYLIAQIVQILLCGFPSLLAIGFLFS